jgi:hypothetical protein
LPAITATGTTTATAKQDPKLLLAFFLRVRRSQESAGRHLEASARCRYCLDFRRPMGRRYYPP